MVCDQCAVRRNLAEGTLEQCGSGDVKAIKVLLTELLQDASHNYIKH